MFFKPNQALATHLNSNAIDRVSSYLACTQGQISVSTFVRQVSTNHLSTGISGNFVQQLRDGSLSSPLLLEWCNAKQCYLHGLERGLATLISNTQYSSHSTLYKAFLTHIKQLENSLHQQALLLSRTTADTPRYTNLDLIAQTQIKSLQIHSRHSQALIAAIYVYPAFCKAMGDAFTAQPIPSSAPLHQQLVEQFYHDPALHALEAELSTHCDAVEEAMKDKPPVMRQLMIDATLTAMQLEKSGLMPTVSEPLVMVQDLTICHPSSLGA